MQNKLRQVTDNVHGTIYLSDFESRMMSTPFFYRLHDIYQNSTVYMTFPANRTKRYEHSLGTMHIAGDMFFSSIANAEKDTKQAFVDALSKSFFIIADAFKDRNKTPFYWMAFEDNNIPSGSALPKSYFKTRSALKKTIANAMQRNVIADIALEHQRVCFFDLLEDPSPGNEKSDPDNVLLYAFLYQCALEAVRIVALFHDVGHPPYSHILEETLCDIFYNCKACLDSSNSKYSSSKAQDVVKMLEPFVESYLPPSLLLDSGKSISAPLHESIGLKMLQNAFSGILPQMRQTAYLDSTTASDRIVRCLYYVTVVEFTFSILFEHTPVFKAIHRMIDGPIDADRLDYIVRDSLNAGVDWGRIPYQRIIGSVRLICLGEDAFSIAFPEKMSDDIDDILVERYKVFARINFHHRSTKTSRLLQKAVFLLAEDYLKAKDDSSCICPEICNLWMSLGGTLGTKETENKIVMWNDSWLVSTLHTALIKLSDDDTVDDLNAEAQGQDTLRIYELLEEILVNRKRYFSLLKRQMDAKKLISGIFEKAQITDARLTEILKHEYNKLTSSVGTDSQEAQESLFRINVLLTKIKSEASFEDLEIYFPFGSCKDLIVDVLDQAIEKRVIRDYSVSPNAVRSKLGISDKDKDWIYLYAPDGAHYVYDINETLIPLLLAQRATSLWLNVYVNPLNRQTPEKALEDLTNQIESKLGSALKNIFSELFSASSSVASALDPL